MNSTIIKKTGSHYTSSNLSSYMAKKLAHYYRSQQQNFGNNPTVLDPSCGNGDLLKAAASEFNNDSMDFIGVDTNALAIFQAKEYLQSYSNTYLFNQDYLELFPSEEDFDLFSTQIDEPEGYLFEKGILKPIDLIIANPPYVRTQVIGADKSQELGSKFNLKGRVDLYQVFLVAMTRHLKEDGLICVITSNRYLTTTGGKDIRKYLNDNYEILEVIDLGDTKLFDAAVLPAIFIGRKRRENEKVENKAVKFTRMYEHNKDIAENVEVKKSLSIFEVLEKEESGIFEVENKFYTVTVGYLSTPEDPKDLWVMASKEDKEWANQLKYNAKFEFEDVFNVRVGIKTTADAVFIRDEWGNLPEEQIPESELIYPLISSDDAARWAIDENSIHLNILYTHKENKGKKTAIDLNKYPCAANYLNSHRERLEGRTYIQKAKRNWYEIWVPQDPYRLSKPKVVFPDISPSPKFAIDLNGYMVDGNCYWLTPKNDEEIDLLYLATAIGNSRIMNKYHEIEFQNVLYSGRKRYLTQYVNHYLLPDPSNVLSREIVNLVKQITSGNLTLKEIIELEKVIENKIAAAFNIDMI